MVSSLRADCGVVGRTSFLFSSVILTCPLSFCSTNGTKSYWCFVCHVMAPWSRKTPHFVLVVKPANDMENGGLITKKPRWEKNGKRANRRPQIFPGAPLLG